jgi:carbonic anhydrase/acetyltransferase-like protein (isoleucine patch superfamily)
MLASGHKTAVGNNVSVGHGATLRGCTVEDNCLIGMDSVLQEGSHVSAKLAHAGQHMHDDDLMMMQIQPSKGAVALCAAPKA